VGERFAWHPPAETLGRDATIARPTISTGGTSRPSDSARDVRRVELMDDLPTLAYDETSAAGVYAVSLGTGEPAATFATQADPDESAIQPLDDTTRTAIGEVARMTNWEPGTDVRIVIEHDRLGTELWLPLAVAVLMIGCTETVLADWFTRSK
jgi:hypothetical protein